MKASATIGSEQTLNQNLAAALRHYRKEMGWSLDVAAQHTGVSKAMLGQIERQESSPTIAVLWKIATGFRRPLSCFMAPPDFNSAAHKIERQRPANEGMQVVTLFPFEPTTQFEVFEITLDPGYERISEAHDAGVTEHIIVTQGSLELLIENNWQVLVAGQAIRFTADKIHGYRNTGSIEAVMHDIIYYPQ